MKNKKEEQSMKQKILKLFLGVAVFWAVTQGAQTLQAAEITDTVGEEIIQYIEEVQYVEKLQYYGTGSDLMTYEEAVEFLKEQVSAKEEILLLRFPGKLMIHTVQMVYWMLF